jgi:hypothetical protein
MLVLKTRKNFRSRDSYSLEMTRMVAGRARWPQSEDCLYARKCPFIRLCASGQKAFHEFGVEIAGAKFGIGKDFLVHGD